jgi:hypothetical protein
MADIDKVSIKQLPTNTDIKSDDYLIVQDSVNTSIIKFKDIVFGPDNVSFYDEIVELRNKLTALETLVQANSASSGWS